MREWADILHEQKCGGERELEPRTVEIGSRYEHWWCGHFRGIITINAENKDWVEKHLNDPLDDCTEFRKLK